MDFRPYSRKTTIVKISENRKIFLPFVKKWHQDLGQTSSIPNGVPWHRSYTLVSICLLMISLSSWILGPQAEKGGNGTKQTRTRINTCRQHRIQFKVKRDLKRTRLWSTTRTASRWDNGNAHINISGKQCKTAPSRMHNINTKQQTRDDIEGAVK